MKKYFLILLFTLSCSASFAQFWENQDPQRSLLISGGSVSVFQMKPGNADVISNMFNAVPYLGFGEDFQINDYLSVNPRISIAGKGARVDEYILSQYSANLAIENYNLYYLQASFDIIAHIPLGGKASIFAGAGPFYGYGLFGTAKIIDTGNEVDYKLRFGNGSDFKPSDYGVTSTFGFQTGKGYILSLNLDYGLANIHQDNTYYMAGKPLYSRSVYFSVGRSF